MRTTAEIVARLHEIKRDDVPDNEDFQRMLADGACHPSCGSCRS